MTEIVPYPGTGSNGGIGPGLVVSSGDNILVFGDGFLVNNDIITVDTGTSGSKIPLLSGVNSWSAAQQFATLSASAPIFTGALTFSGLGLGGIGINGSANVIRAGWLSAISNGGSTTWTPTSVPEGKALLAVNGGQTGTIPTTGAFAPITVGISSDTVDAAANSSGGFQAVSVSQNYGGAAMTGSRRGMLIQSSQTGSIVNAGSVFIDGINTWMSASMPANGANLIVMNPQINMTSGATGWALAELSEGSVSVNAAITGRIGHNVYAGGTFQGSSYDFAYGVTGVSGSASPWKIGVSFGVPINRWGIDPLGSLISTNPQVNGISVVPQLAAYGADFRKVNFSVASWASPGMTIGGDGTTSIGTAQIAPIASGIKVDAVGYSGGSPTVSTAGTSYVVNDQLYDEQGGIIQVDTVNGSGGILTWHYLRTPYYFGGSPPATMTLIGGNGNQAAVVGVTWTQNTTLSLQPSGGPIKLGSGAFTVNGSVATAMTSLGPAGSHTTVQEWFTITNASGVVRYIPAF